MKHTFLALGAGILSGVLSLAAQSSASFAVVYLVLLLPLPMLMVGLSLGTRPAAIAVATATVIVGSVDQVAGMMFALVHALPIWLVVRLALTGPTGPVANIPERTGEQSPEGRETSSTFGDRILGRVKDWEGETDLPPRDEGWLPAGRLIAVITVMAAVGILIAALSSAGSFEETVREHLINAFDEIGGKQDQDVLKDAAVMFAALFPGAVAGMWAILLVFDTVIAQALLARGGRNIRPSPRLRELTLPDWLSWVLIVAAVAALMGPGDVGYTGRNLAMVLAVPFYFLGLAVLHKMASLVTFSGMLMAMFYVAMFTGWFILVVAGLGLLEQWVGLKKRLSPPA
ncbi:DUF2232 domain-containing protein [Pseudomonadota bacterium]